MNEQPSMKLMFKGYQGDFPGELFCQLRRRRKCEADCECPLYSLKMESKRLFSDKNHSAHKPEQQSSIDGTKHFFAADPVPVAEGKSAHSSQKT